jgi:hypothetical protein
MPEDYHFAVQSFKRGLKLPGPFVLTVEKHPSDQLARLRPEFHWSVRVAYGRAAPEQNPSAILQVFHLS